MNGAPLGITLAMPLCGLLAQSSGGWPSVFYVSASLGAAWSLLWARIGADSPAEHSSISRDEKEFIERSLANTTSNKLYKTPWRKIFTSVPFWALIATHLGNGWSFSILITETPSFINSILNFDIGANGFLSALPYLSMWIVAFPACWVADYLLKNKIASNNFVRKFWTTIYIHRDIFNFRFLNFFVLFSAQGGRGFALILLGYISYNTTAAIVTLTMAVTASAFMFSGFHINHLDLSPKFVGTLMGIANGLENISAIIAPLTVGLFVKNQESLEEWRFVFLITGFVTIFGNIIFVLFGSAKIQLWNFPTEDNEKQRISYTENKGP
uniref:Major facilitator superfamily (MFS) profile domain-containing protein n=1 Tax=Rhodnius prolixus TaxID=13249 RepID=T1I157_RHOPR